ncbi:glycosyltransferase [uncultured Thiodictyon sp.]|uniref:glycosyltransferase n=1 Tax=uncultured Thiodictyon sp. TaxID=1846217 RepID=UPI0025EC28E0|nr:glycosyltransferase [uncultured Thiodictyon sp.]
MEKPEFDVSIVLNIYREAVYLCRTLQSLYEAASYAQHCGLRVELVVVFDRSDELTRAAFESAYTFGVDRVTCIEVEHGSLGLARNSGIAAASGEFVWLADSDDLMSFNCITCMHLIAQSERRSVVFPEYCIAFGTAWWVLKYFDDSFVTAADFVFKHPYISRLFIRRSAFLDVQYADLRLSKGFAYEDWLLNCELRARSYRFLIAPKTLFFYRQREGSLVRQANMISVRAIPHSTLFEPRRFILAVEAERVAQSDYEYRRRREQARNVVPRDELLKDVTCMELVSAAVRIDPGIAGDGMEWGQVCAVNFPPEQHWGQAFFDVCKCVGWEKFTDIALLPGALMEGDERLILDVLGALEALEPDTRFLVISGEPGTRPGWPTRLPPHWVCLDLCRFVPNLTEDDRDQLVFRTILACAGSRARIHLKVSPFTHGLYNKYSHCLGEFKNICYRFSESHCFLGGESFEVGYSFDFISNHLLALSLIITDHERMAIDARRRFGIFPNKWQCLYAKHATKSSRDEDSPKMRLLWASCVSYAQRPKLLTAVACAALQLVPGVSIDAFGVAGTDVNIGERFPASGGLTFRGPYLDFDALEPATYDAFIYTTNCDCFPDVVLDAMSWGLPIIAPDFNGLRDAMADGRAGFLLPDLRDDDAICLAYARAIYQLYRDWGATLAMGKAAQELMRRRHGAATFKQRVAEIFRAEEAA